MGLGRRGGSVYGAIAGFGLTAISTLLVRQQGALRMVGGLFLRYWVSGRSWRAPPTTRRARVGQASSARLRRRSGSTLANPATILSFVAVFGGLGIAGAGGWREATDPCRRRVPGLGPVVAELSGTVGSMRARLDPRVLRWVNRLSGLVLLVFGVTALAWR